MNHKNPFIKVTWQDTSENFTAEKLRRVKSYFQNKYNTKSVTIITKTLLVTEDTKLKSLDISENIVDHNYQKTLMKDFIDENKIEIKFDLIDRLDNKVNEKVLSLNETKIRYNKWYLKKIEFSNFLSFGEDNVIDFTDLNGITVIESTPKNFGGKSTATVDLLMFLFFNSTTKTKTNSEIFNRFTDDDEVKVKGYIAIDGDDYVIERITNRKKSKTGDYTITNKLEFYKENSDGTIENLTGEQRRETEAFITTAIGSEEDFLSTILTTGYNLEQLIESKPTARGLILTKFLGLENLKQKEEICKEMYNEWSEKLVSNTYNTSQLETDNLNYEKEIVELDIQHEKLVINLKQTEENLTAFEKRKDEILSSRNNDVDQDLIKVNPTSLQKEIDDLKVKKQTSEKSANDVVVTEPSKYYLEEDHEIVKTELNGVIIEGRVNLDAIGRQEKLVEQLEKGQICPTCKRALDEVDHTEEINKIKELVISLKTIQEENLKNQSELTIKEKGFSDLKKEYDEYEKNKLRKGRYELEVEQKQIEIDARQLKIDIYETNRKKLEDNQKIDGELIGLKTQIESGKADIRQIGSNIEKTKSNVKSLNEKIVINNDLIKKIKTENEIMTTFKVYLSIFGKNGISKIILKNMIPLINQELYRLLVDSCNFILELNITDKNEVDFFMIDTETRVVKPLSSGSGYERTISSLALRSVLTKVSSLPKPNIVVMDEVFGKIADENLEMVGEFFKKIKMYFDHIFVISHNPLIRNWSDNIIMIKKEENISSIDFITTKIS